MCSLKLAKIHGCFLLLIFTFVVCGGFCHRFVHRGGGADALASYQKIMTEDLHDALNKGGSQLQGVKVFNYDPPENRSDRDKSASETGTIWLSKVGARIHNLSINYMKFTFSKHLQNRRLSMIQWETLGCQVSNALNNLPKEMLPKT